MPPSSVASITLWIAGIVVVSVVASFFGSPLTKEQLATILTPAIGATASLIFCLASRNTSISDRLRTTVKDLDTATLEMDKERIDNLGNQLKAFWLRFKFNLLSFALLILAVPAFAVGYVWAALGSPVPGSKVFCSGATLAFVGFALTIVDLVYSRVTLKCEYEYGRGFINEAGQIRKQNKESDVIRAKKADVAMFCLTQYDQIMFGKRSHDHANETPFCLRFWNLQYEQFEFWRDGMLDESRYAQWLGYRKRSFDEKDKEYVKSWKAAENKIGTARFRSFIDTVHASGPDEALKVFKAA